uniref:Nucleotide-diphospho-sugar transferase domain-containing protein n=1 Tax=Entomoneis paludosa TaxID=265537 RepID=A0A7S2Y3Q1_9STRA|mmetsp:Transcript_13999/g.28989  ORF Transcript_13999/g.28989 Transcript_13999/m.28989 type:complete len:415 (+) Transcript_13999:57-1301(+)
MLCNRRQSTIGVLLLGLMVLLVAIPSIRETTELSFDLAASRNVWGISVGPATTPNSSQGHPVSNPNNTSALMHLDNTENYKILGFTDEFYLPHAIRWFQEMTQNPLSYPTRNVVVAAMNPSTLHQLRAQNITAQPCGFQEEDGSADSTGPRVKSMTRRRRLFAARWHCVLEELKKGVNIVLTDVDNHFTRHVPIVQSFSHWNVMHAYSNGYPLNVQAAIGFTICGGMSWLQAHPATIQYVQMIVNRCGSGCDDQVVMNSMMADPSILQIEWTVDPVALVEHDPNRILSHHGPSFVNSTNTSNKNTASTTSNWKEPYAAQYGQSKVTGHSVYIWNREFAYRGPLEATPCPRPSENWVAMPSNQKGQKMARLWPVHCPPTPATEGANASAIHQTPAVSSFPPLSQLLSGQEKATPT